MAPVLATCWNSVLVNWKKAQLKWHTRVCRCCLYLWELAGGCFIHQSFLSFPLFLSVPSVAVARLGATWPLPVWRHPMTQPSCSGHTLRIQAEHKILQRISYSIKGHCIFGPNFESDLFIVVTSYNDTCYSWFCGIEAECLMINARGFGSALSPSASVRAFLFSPRPALQ